MIASRRTGSGRIRADRIETGLGSLLQKTRHRNAEGAEQRSFVASRRIGADRRVRSKRAQKSSRCSLRLGVAFSEQAAVSALVRRRSTEALHDRRAMGASLHRHGRSRHARKGPRCSLRLCVELSGSADVTQPEQRRSSTEALPDRRSMGASLNRHGRSKRAPKGPRCSLRLGVAFSEQAAVSALVRRRSTEALHDRRAMGASLNRHGRSRHARKGPRCSLRLGVACSGRAPVSARI